MGRGYALSPPWVRTRSQEPPHQRRWGVQAQLQLSREEQTQSLRLWAAEHGGCRKTDAGVRRGRAGVADLSPQMLVEGFSAEDQSPSRVPHPPPPSPAAPEDGSEAAVPPVAPPTVLPNTVPAQPSPPRPVMPPPADLQQQPYDPPAHPDPHMQAPAYIPDDVPAMASGDYCYAPQYSASVSDTSSQATDVYSSGATSQSDYRMVGEQQCADVHRLQHQLAQAQDMMSRMITRVRQKDEQISQLQAMAAPAPYAPPPQPQARVVHAAPTHQTIVLQPSYVRIPARQVQQIHTSPTIPQFLAVQTQQVHAPASPVFAEQPGAVESAFVHEEHRMDQPPPVQPPPPPQQSVPPAQPPVTPQPQPPDPPIEQPAPQPQPPPVTRTAEVQSGSQGQTQTTAVQQTRVTLPSGATLLMPAPPASAAIPQVVKHYALAPAKTTTAAP